MKMSKFTSVILAVAAIAVMGGCCSKCPMFSSEKDACGPKAVALNDDSIAALAERGPNFAKAAEFMKKNDISKFSDGTYKIDGDNVFMFVADNQLRPMEGAALEAHKKYSDIQYVISGEEKIGLKNTGDCKFVKSPYVCKNDIMFFFDSYSDFVELKSGEFVVLTPSDAHAPLLGKGKVRKVVFKVKE